MRPPQSVEHDAEPAQLGRGRLKVRHLKLRPQSGPAVVSSATVPPLNEDPSMCSDEDQVLTGQWGEWRRTRTDGGPKGARDVGQARAREARRVPRSQGRTGHPSTRPWLRPLGRCKTVPSLFGAQFWGRYCPSINRPFAAGAVLGSPIHCYARSRHSAVSVQLLFAWTRWSGPVGTNSLIERHQTLWWAHDIAIGE